MTDTFSGRVWDLIAAGVTDRAEMSRALGRTRKDISRRIADMIGTGRLKRVDGKLVAVSRPRRSGRCTYHRGFFRARPVSHAQVLILAECTSVYGRTHAEIARHGKLALECLVRRGLLARERRPSAREPGKTAHKARYYTTDLGMEILAERQKDAA